MSDTGWFADHAMPDEDHDPRWPWLIAIQLDGLCPTLSSPRFATKEECEEFIRDNLLGQGLLDP